MSSSPVLQTVPLGFQWPTIDPFLFCVHHLDQYPAADGALGPAASLEGREIGSDFAGIDGWRMYHGSHVPGFPAHPHRGFETITFVRRGLIDHSDSMGAAARYGRGDVQWLTAGSGIQHAEMFPLLDTAGPNTAELFQIWLNLPAAGKRSEPHFEMFWAEDLPHHLVSDEQGRAVDVTVIAGALEGVTPLAPPPDSWAARDDSDLALWHAVFDAEASWTLPPAAGPDTVRVLYVFEGEGLRIAGAQAVGAATAVVLDPTAAVTLTASGPTEVLVLQGRPIGEPVARYGPFVMNTEAEIREAFEDYRRTEFGGWPWDASDPTHGHDDVRFARHTDGRIDTPATASL